MKMRGWEIVYKNGRTIYQLYSDGWRNPLYLRKGSNAILFIMDAALNLLAGDEDFSYTLNRTTDQEPAQ